MSKRSRASLLRAAAVRQKKRRLRVETLERRELLAVDIASFVSLNHGTTIGGGTLSLSDGDQFGSAIAPVDTDNDGVAEYLLVGSPQARSGQGEVRLIELGAGADFVSEIVLADGTAGITAGSIDPEFGVPGAKDIAFGSSIAVIGANASFLDIAVGAPGSGPSEAGELHILEFDFFSGVVNTHSRLVADAGFSVGATDRLGSAVVYGDFDGDGSNEIAVGADKKLIFRLLIQPDYCFGRL